MSELIEWAESDVLDSFQKKELQEVAGPDFLEDLNEHRVEKPWFEEICSFYDSMKPFTW